MSNVDFSAVTALTAQIKALQDAAAVATDPTVKALLNAQAGAASSQLNTQLQHMQAQADASSNLLDTMGLFATLTSVAGSAAPAIVDLFKK